ncbi:MAG: hypothetical protein JNL28_13580 [Planctomycetes bacterium]|nr:hypothetical protein [Planctomycetota bacterium]
MNDNPHDRTKPFTTRLVALVLVCAFVLQSAAQASQGCLARVFTGACCCVAVDAAPAHACCAQAPEEPTDEPSDAPQVVAPGACACAFAAQPPLPVAPQTPDSACERSLVRILHAAPIAHFAGLAIAVVSPVEQRALERPPGDRGVARASFTRTRLAQRGVAGFLAELCTLHR